MDIQKIIDGIVEAGDQQITSIKNNAESQVNSIRSKAESEASAQKERILKDAQVRLNRTEALIDQKAEMQALQMHADARQALIVKVLEQAREKIAQFRVNKEYTGILEKSINDALVSLKSSMIKDQVMILHLDKRDKALLKDFEIPFKERVNVQFDINCSGGCEVESEDGFVRALNTFESRFDRALPSIQQSLSKFFEEKVASS